VGSLYIYIALIISVRSRFCEPVEFTITLSVVHVRTWCLTKNVTPTKNTEKRNGGCTTHFKSNVFVEETCCLWVNKTLSSKRRGAIYYRDEITRGRRTRLIGRKHARARKVPENCLGLYIYGGVFTARDGQPYTTFRERIFKRPSGLNRTSRSDDYERFEKHPSESVTYYGCVHATKIIDFNSRRFLKYRFFYNSAPVGPAESYQFLGSSRK